MNKQVATVVVARANGVCEAMCSPACVGEAQHLHHRKISGREHAVANLLHVCHVCHGWIHKNPRLAYASGLLVKMGADYDTTPVMYRRQLVTLCADGGLVF